jgi:hypothetical protein
MGSLFFRNYERTMRRVYWLEFVEEQLEAVHRERFCTSLEPSAGETGTRSNADRRRRPNQRR